MRIGQSIVFIRSIAVLFGGIVKKTPAALKIQAVIL
jgi:hypothetical protein